MSWGRSNEQWNHTASLMTLLATIHCDPDSGQKPQLGTYHPYLPEPEMPTISPESLTALIRSIGMGRGKGGDA